MRKGREEFAHPCIAKEKFNERKKCTGIEMEKNHCTIMEAKVLPLTSTSMMRQSYNKTTRSLDKKVSGSFYYLESKKAAFDGPIKYSSCIARVRATYKSLRSTVVSKKGVSKAATITASNSNPFAKWLGTTSKAC